MQSDMHPIEFMARKEQWDRGISIYARQVIEGLSIAIAQPMVFDVKPIKEMVMDDKPLIKLEIQSAQQLMDQLWECGLRPSEWL